MTLSAIDVELLRNLLSGYADEMYLALMKSAYSTNIKERRDHSTAIFDARGRIVVQGDSLPLHLASMMGLVEVVLDRYAITEMAPGDIFISNDPFVGRGSHLPDVALVAPVFHGEELCMFVANLAHHADMGGMVPGSMAAGMTEIYQEGLRIPPIRLVRQGELVQDVFDLILLNVRVPSERRGDYLAQIAAIRLGERRLQAFFRKTNRKAIDEGCERMLAAVARRFRAGIAEIPDGEYRFADTIDDDGMGTTDIRIEVCATVTGDFVAFDFAGSSPQVRGNINNSWAGLQACVLYALKVLVDSDGPSNHGMMEAISIKAPAGSVVNASFPAATAARAQTCQRVIDVVIGAFSTAIPDRVIAAGNGANTTASFAGIGPDGRYYVYMETLGGGAGARSYKDGADGIQVHVTNTSNLPIESLEREYPILIERYELVADSGGAGKFRGGMGIRRDYRALGHTMTMGMQGERFRSRPWGLWGAGPGANGSHSLHFDDGTQAILSSKQTPIEVPSHAVASIVTPGAGGYGPPAERDPEQLRDDLLDGKFSPEFIAMHYPELSEGIPEKHGSDDTVDSRSRQVTSE